MTDRYAAVHKTENLKGPGDARPTGVQIVENDDLVGKYKDRVMLITGCSSGIGPETVRALTATGAKVYATARDVKKGEDALKGILEPGRVELLQLDQSSLDNVKKFAEEFLNKNNRLDVLVCNAGIMALRENTKSPDGHELQFATNHLSHFLLFQLLKPLLFKSAIPELSSRVVMVASNGHRVGGGVQFDDIGLDKNYSEWLGYGQSKTAMIYTANEIDRRYGPKGVHAWSLDPGGIWTGLQKHVDLSEFKGKPEVERSMKSTAQGAATQTWAAVGVALEGKGGKYLESCQFAPPADEELGIYGPGYAKWTTDSEAAKKLWSVSCEMVGVSDD